jgi:hypothetical protein
MTAGIEMRGGWRKLPGAGLNGTGVLFAEDFDLPEPVLATATEAPEPEVIPPEEAAAELAAAREAGFAAGQAAGHTAGRAEAEAENRARATQALAAIALAMDEAAARAAAEAGRVAEALAGLLLDTLLAALPATCAHHGEAEARAVVRALLPPLLAEPAITVRIHPDIEAAIAAELRDCDADLASRVRLAPEPALAPGDVRIAWKGGNAMRDGRAITEAVAAAFAETGLISSIVSPSAAPSAAPAAVPSAAKEAALA